MEETWNPNVLKELKEKKEASRKRKAGKHNMLAKGYDRPLRRAFVCNNNRTPVADIFPGRVKKTSLSSLRLDIKGACQGHTSQPVKPAFHKLQIANFKRTTESHKYKVLRYLSLLANGYELK